MLLNAVGDIDSNTGKYVATGEKLSQPDSNLSPRTAVYEQVGQPARGVLRHEPKRAAISGLRSDD
jgi:hypothetical protein